MNPRNFFAELKRRNVLRAAAFYAASAWLLVQVATQVFPLFHIAEWVMRWIVVAAVIGLPFAIIFSWFYEWTPQGLQRESDITPNESISRQTGKRLDRWIIAILAFAVVLLLTNQFVWHKNAGEATAIPDKSIAVLPLSNESGARDELYFADGLSEGLITALSQFAGLKVINRNSSFQFRDSKEDSKIIGAKLGVAHLLEGSVRRAADAVRISAELVNVADGTTLWSEHYDRPYKDLFKLQDDITTAVANALKAKLLNSSDAPAQSDRPPSGNLAAYNAFLQGQFYNQRNTEADYRKAIESFQTAIGFDPKYARAYAALAGAETFLADYSKGAQAQQTFAAARTAVNTALALNPNLAAAHGTRGLLLLLADIDIAGTEAEFKRAAELAPNDLDLRASLAEVHASLGHPEGAIEPIRQALAADPRSSGWYGLLASDLMAVGRLDEAERAVRQQLALQPTEDGPKARLSTIEVLRGNAAAALEKAEQVPPGKSRDFALANARQIGNDRTAADATLKTLIDHYGDTDAYLISRCYALRKEPDRMFASLDRAWANRDNNVSILYYDPFLLRCKSDPRFAAFCSKVGLPTPAEIAAEPKS
jgi:TolB-like protein/Flp pilus assembly protein TadD